jgi:hypothetical protein
MRATIIVRLCIWSPLVRAAAHFTAMKCCAGEADYVRPGDHWYRNPEFGKVVSDPRKRGRNGAGYGKYLGQLEMNPYPPGETYQRAHKPYVAPSDGTP